MTDNPLAKRGRSLEEEFFAQRNQEKLAALRAEVQERAQKQGIKDASGIENEAVLEHLVDLGVTAEALSALALVPLVQVAWADGALEDKERQAVLRAAAARGIEPGNPAHELLSSWLHEMPDVRLREAWLEFVASMRSAMPAEKLAALRDEILGRAREVAKATGGFLGLGSKISAPEKAVLEEMEAAFGAS